MLSMSAIKASPTVATNYYVKGDYYTKGEDEPSAWTGNGAAALGLEGGVDAGTFKAVLEGNLPAGHKAGWEKSNSEHRPGWDLTFNAPKSVSILATLGDDKRLVDAHMAAVKEALEFVETYAHVRERREDSTIIHKATGNIVAAQFTEFFSRALDPHLHTHCPVANMTYDKERGAWYALESHPLLKMKMAAGQVYRSALALTVKDLGYTAFNSVRFATLIIANVPFATAGGLIGLFVTGQYVSVPSAIGFIAVFGVAMLNGIVLVSFINELRAKGMGVRDAVQRGTELRLRPVLMTASVAILGLVPMLLSSGVGAETQRPLATVVVGGLITSTLLTLVLLPVIYDWMESRGGKINPLPSKNEVSS